MKETEMLILKNKKIEPQDRFFPTEHRVFRLSTSL